MTGQSGPAHPQARRGTAAELFQTMLAQFQQVERLPREQQLAHQLQAADFLLQHVWQQSAFHRGRLSAAGWEPGVPLTPEAWHRLPVLTRQDVQTAGDSLFSRQLPPHHGQRATAHTSGSTGEPVRVQTTGLTGLYWNALTLRDYDWHGADYSAKVATIRHFFQDGVGEPPDGTHLPNWGGVIARVRSTGPAAVLHMTADVETQARWLLDQNPEHLVTMPTVLQALLDWFRQHDRELPGLRTVRTVGEPVTPELRQQCRQVWQASLIDVYSSQEIGYIGLQCPETERYHVPVESLLVEVLDDSGQPCQPGEVGRVVITSLHNYATGLIRYEIGDYAEV
ncbi:MAG: phenylacetate--CoA ligase family protein, partial [Planctomycetaceae bacterium]|nr:phenylacetate--CoA ligase family protein [Planctomycetaceae bacterium]